MDNKIGINQLVAVELFSKIIPQIMDWDLSPIEGVGYYRKIQHYGHIELKMYITEGIYTQPEIIWNIEEYQIPKEPIREVINKHLSFFYNFLVSIKGNRLNLKIEITNGSFHPVDSGRWGFPNATICALINCFDKDFNNLGGATKYTEIKNLQTYALNELRSKAATFPDEVIFNSLKDLGLNQIIRNILSTKNLTSLNHYINKVSLVTNQDFFDYLVKDIPQEVIENLKTVNIISKYNSLTNIGLAHIALILKNERLLRTLNIKNLDSLYGYYDISFMS